MNKEKDKYKEKEFKTFDITKEEMKTILKVLNKNEKKK